MRKTGPNRHRTGSDGLGAVLPGDGPALAVKAPYAVVEAACNGLGLLGFGLEAQQYDDVSTHAPLRIQERLCRLDQARQLPVAAAPDVARAIADFGKGKLNAFHGRNAVVWAELSGVRNSWACFG